MSIDPQALDSDEIRELLSQSESETLEFKTDLRDARQTAAMIAAMANSGGGKIVVGANEYSKEVGLQDPARTRRVLEAGAQAVHPPVPMSVREGRLDGDSMLLLAELRPQTGGPFIPPSGAILKRDPRGQNVALSGAELAREARASGPSETGRLLGEMNERLKKMQEEAENSAEEARVAFDEAKKARSIKGQLSGWLISGVIGALIGVAASLLIGVP